MAPSSEKEMPFLDHLEELRTRLFWVIGSIVLSLFVGCAVSFGVPQLTEFITAPITPFLTAGPNGGPTQLVTMTVTGAFRFKMTIALYIAVFLSLPVILYHIWGFLSPGLYANERKLMIPVLAGGTILFMLGVILAFKVALPLSLKFLLGLGEQNFTVMPTIESYFDILILMCAAFGAMFELPMVILALTWLGVVTPQVLSRFRRYAVVILLVICAVLTPTPDVMSLSIMFVPVYLLYEISVVASYVLWRKRQKKEAAVDDAAAHA